MSLVLADHGSFTVSLMFGAPVAAMLLGLVIVTLRDRRHARRSVADRGRS